MPLGGVIYGGYSDSIVARNRQCYTHVYTSQHDAGFIAAYHDKKFAETLQFGSPPHYFDRYPASVWNNTHWLEEYIDGAAITCLQKNLLMAIMVFDNEELRRIFILAK
ncbi:MAG: hypothetical protein JO327_07505 [Nitrososphaeraceae archaeon]|nr:hypothetical protein [Nitrososphaeraceae archaeon]